MKRGISRRQILAGMTAAVVPAAVPLQGPGRPLQGPTTPASQFINQAPDRFSLLDPGTVTLNGFLGERCLKNERARLLTKNEEELLGGFQQRPGKQAWVGEHVGKWLHAAALAWAFTRDGDLRAKLDRVVAALIATQQPDGYLGTYADGAHWGMGPNEKWDVWVHKYNLIGLTAYAGITGEKSALEAAVKIGDLLLKTFGSAADGPPPLDLNERSTHVGMASGSIVEPMVLLARATGDTKYLAFARLIAEKWEAPNGPKLISSLTAQKPVAQTANGKAYEMMSCLVGLCELYRATGETRYLTPAVNAWRDIVAGQLLITGSGSSREHWTAPREYPSDARADVAETCVTVTWLQLNLQLLRLTGEARYADELEKTVYNHLAAAQHPDGGQWAYFTAHNGTKPYRAEQNCCTSSGPRGWALLPAFAYLASEDGIVVNLFAPGTATFQINGQRVQVKQETNYPFDGRVSLTVTVPQPVKFSLRFRVPAWSSLDGLKAKPGDYWLLRQTWSRTQTLQFKLAMPLRVVTGEGSNAGRLALVRGPLVLSLDQRFNPELGEISPNVRPAEDPPLLKTSVQYRTPEGVPVFETDGIVTAPTGKLAAGDRVPLRFTPFASAGASGDPYLIWLPSKST